MQHPIHECCQPRQPNIIQSSASAFSPSVSQYLAVDSCFFHAGGVLGDTPCNTERACSNCA